MKKNLSVLAREIVERCAQKGASETELTLGKSHSFTLLSRLGEIESIEYESDVELDVTVYLGHRKGMASTTDLSDDSIRLIIDKAHAIAKQAQEDPYAGLADASLMPEVVLDLDLYHPWALTPEEAKEKTIACERLAMAQDKRITNSEGCSVTVGEGESVYANSHGFVGEMKATHHEIACSLIAEANGEKQRDYSYTVATRREDLEDWSWVAKNTAQRTVHRLNAQTMKTCKTPVVFAADVARSLLRSFVAAISGGSLYRESSFLLNHLGQQIFPSDITIYEEPHLLRGLGSAPFDADGVSTYEKNFVTDGVLSSYSLGDYAAKRLKMKTTANSGGVHNLQITHSDKTLAALLQEMNRGLLVTELIGQGVNIVTGDYSRGVFGYWVENGEIQYPVHEITIAGHLKEMFKRIVAVGNDVDKRSSIQTGSILIEEMMLAGN